jgi:hypothetical protein
MMREKVHLNEVKTGISGEGFRPVVVSGFCIGAATKFFFSPGFSQPFCQ